MLTLNPDTENLIMGGVKKSGNTSYVSLSPDIMKKIISSHIKEESKIKEHTDDVIVLTSPIVRFYYKRLIEQFSSEAVVLSFNEINSDVSIQSLGTITVENPAGK